MDLSQIQPFLRGHNIYSSGDLILPNYGPASWSTLALAADRIHLIPFIINAPVLLAGINFYQTVVATGVHAKLGILEDASVPSTAAAAGTKKAGAFVTGSDITFTSGGVANVQNVLSFASPVALRKPGRYWGAFLPDAAITITAASSLSQNTDLNPFGAAALGANSTGIGRAPFYAQAYASGIPADMTANALDFATITPPTNAPVMAFRVN